MAVGSENVKVREGVTFVVEKVNDVVMVLILKLFVAVTGVNEKETVRVGSVIETVPVGRDQLTLELKLLLPVGRDSDTDSVAVGKDRESVSEFDSDSDAVGIDNVIVVVTD